MAGRIAAYRVELSSRTDWPAYLMAESRLPGPRANLELVAAAGEEAGDDAIAALLTTAEQAADDPRAEFLIVCAAVALGRRATEGSATALPALRRLANDERWRVREGVAMGLQRLADVSFVRTLDTAAEWASGTDFERRAAAAGVCESRLLHDEADAIAVFALLDRLTAGLAESADRRSPGFRALRQALGYCWSVAIAAYPGPGKAAFERWLPSTDGDIRWVLIENLKKARLSRMDVEWVRSRRVSLSSGR